MPDKPPPLTPEEERKKNRALAILYTCMIIGVFLPLILFLIYGKK